MLTDTGRLQHSSGVGAGGSSCVRTWCCGGTYPQDDAAAKSLGKRCRGVDDAPDDRNQDVNHGHRPSPCKRGKAKIAITTGVLEADKPAARTPAYINRKSKAARCGAGRLATPNAQGVSDRSLQGPSVQQASTGAIVQGQQPWVEGSVEGAIEHHIGSTVPQQDKTVPHVETSQLKEAERSTVFYIPKSLDTRQRALLKATSDDWARGAIRVIKCRLCPDAGFGNFEIFKRHCKAGRRTRLRSPFACTAVTCSHGLTRWTGTTRGGPKSATMLAPP